MGKQGGETRQGNKAGKQGGKTGWEAGRGSREAGRGEGGYTDKAGGAVISSCGGRVCKICQLRHQRNRTKEPLPVAFCSETATGLFETTAHSNVKSARQVETTQILDQAKSVKEPTDCLKDV